MVIKIIEEIYKNGFLYEQKLKCSAKEDWELLHLARNKKARIKRYITKHRLKEPYVIVELYRVDDDLPTDYQIENSESGEVIRSEKNRI